MDSQPRPSQPHEDTLRLRDQGHPHYQDLTDPVHSTTTDTHPETGDVVAPDPAADAPDPD